MNQTNPDEQHQDSKQQLRTTISYRCCEHWKCLRESFLELLQIQYWAQISKVLRTEAVFKLSCQFLCSLYCSQEQTSYTKEEFPEKTKSFLAVFLVHKFPEKMVGSDLEDEHTQLVLKNAKELATWFLECEILPENLESGQQLMDQWIQSWESRINEEKQHLRDIFFQDLYTTLFNIELHNKAKKGIGSLGIVLRLICTKLTEFGGPQVADKFFLEAKTKALEEVNKIQIVDVESIALDICSQRYWDELGMKIASGDFKQLLEVLTEIKTRILKLTKHDSSDYREFNENLDLDILSNLINQQLFDRTTFEGVYETVWKAIKNIHAPRHDEIWMQWKTNVYKELAQADSWAAIVPSILNKFLCKLDGTEEEIMIIRERISQSKLKQQKQ